MESLPRVAALTVLLASFACTGGGGDPGTSNEAPPPRAATATRVGSADAPGGRIRGRVIYKGRPPARQKLLVVKDVETCGRIDHYDDRLVIGKHSGIANAVVSLRGVEGGRPLDEMGTGFVLDQRACAYRPHVVLAPVGAPVQILNSDGVLHNVHTFSEQNKPFNLAQPKHLTKIERVFEKPERISVRCDVHGWMSAWIVVVDHPYHAVTDEEGNFLLDNIPPGTYSLTSWQELLGEQTVQVTIEENGLQTIDLVYSGLDGL